jgi:TrmH family RNA methyltransferase
MTTPEVAITSATNPRVKAAVRLRDRRERETTGLTIVDGAREIARALDAGVEIVDAFVSDDGSRSAEAQDVIRRLHATARSVASVSGAVIAKLAFGDRSDGIVAVVRVSTLALEDLVIPADPLVVVAESVEKPGNLGAIVRSADSAGADAIIAADPLTDPFNPNAIRASLGTIFRLPLASASSAATLDWLEARAIVTIATRVDAPTLYSDVDLRGPIAIVVGSEADGLTGAWTGSRVTPVRIPMLGGADSLNVSVATAVLLYEAVRQRA